MIFHIKKSGDTKYSDDILFIDSTILDYCVLPLGRFTDAIYSKKCDHFFVYDDSANAIWTLNVASHKMTEVYKNIVGSTRCSRTLRVNMAQDKLFVNANDHRILFGDITSDARLQNLTFVDRGVGGPIADF